MITGASRPRVPFDLSIEVLSCFKDISRAEASQLLDPPTQEGTYLFRYCSDAAEKDASGKRNNELFVLSYRKENRHLNTKIFRHYLGERNALGAPTTRGFVLSEHRDPQRKEHCHATIMGCTISVIGPNAQELR